LGFVVGFSDRGSCAGVIEEVLAGCAGGDERGEGEPVDGAGFARAGWVDVGDGVIGEQRVGSADELEVVAEVAGGFLAGHAGHGAAHGDALFERGQRTQSHLRRERGLAQKDCREGRFGVEPVIRQQPQRLQGVMGEEMSLVDTQDRDPAAFAMFGGQALVRVVEQPQVVDAGGLGRGGRVGFDGGVGVATEAISSIAEQVRSFFAGGTRGAPRLFGPRGPVFGQTTDIWCQRWYHTYVDKTTIYLPDDLKAAVKRAAAQRGISEAEVIRESIRTTVGGVKPRPRGGLYSGPEPIARRVDELLDGFGER